MTKYESDRGESFHRGDRSGPSTWSHRDPERHEEAGAEAGYYDYGSSMPEVAVYRQLKSVRAEVGALLEVEAALAEELENLLPLSGQRIDGELVEPVGDAERKVWDHNRLVDAVIGRIADELGPDGSECRALVEVTLRRISCCSVEPCKPASCSQLWIIFGNDEFRIKAKTLLSKFQFREPSV